MKKNFAKVLSVFLSVLMLMSVVPVPAFADTQYVEGYYTYSVENNQATITAVDTAISGDITIPSTLGGFPVVRIDEDAFLWCKSLESVIVPEGITVGEAGFYGCESLKSVVIYASFSRYAFAYCTSLESVVIKGSFSAINSNAFKGCSSLTSIILPDGIREICENAFDGCIRLESIVLPQSLKNIYGSAFYKCESLTDVYFYGTKEEWDSLYIYGGYGGDNNNACLTEARIHYNYNPDHAHEFETVITTPATHTTEGLQRVSCSCGEFYTEAVPQTATHDYKAEVTPPTCTQKGYTTYTCVCGYSYVGDYVETAEHSYVDGICSVCSAVEIIADGTCGTDAFWTLDAFGVLTVSGSGAMSDYEYNTAPWTENRDLIKKVVIDGNISNIGEYAFSRCKNITSIELGSTITSIGECAFEDCIALKKLTLNDGLETIGSHAFYDCIAL